MAGRLYLLSIVLPCLLLTSCVKTTPPVAIPVPPQQTESVVPRVDEIDSGINDTVKTNHELEDTINYQTASIGNQRIYLERAMVLADKAKTQISGNHMVIDELIDVLGSVKVGNTLLKDQNRELKDIQISQAIILTKTKAMVVDVLDKLRKRDNEIDTLRTQNKFLGDNLKIKNTESEDLKKALTEEKVKSAKSSVYRNWVIGLAVGFALWTIIKNLIMIYSPIKFRI
jgi:hypothetical protein